MRSTYSTAACAAGISPPLTAAPMSASAASPPLAAPLPGGPPAAAAAAEDTTASISTAFTARSTSAASASAARRCGELGKGQMLRQAARTTSYMLQGLLRVCAHNAATISVAHCVSRRKIKHGRHYLLLHTRLLLPQPGAVPRHPKQLFLSKQIAHMTGILLHGHTPSALLTPQDFAKSPITTQTGIRPVMNTAFTALPLRLLGRARQCMQQKGASTSSAAMYASQACASAGSATRRSATAASTKGATRHTLTASACRRSSAARREGLRSSARACRRSSLMFSNAQDLKAARAPEYA